MSYKSFPVPVTILIRQSQQMVIATAWDAIEFLRRWPAKRGSAYRIALQKCLDAMDGVTSPKMAYKAFTRAAREAGILA